MDAVQRPARMGTTTRRTPRPRRTVSAIVPTVERATRPLTTSAQRAPRRQRRGVTLEIRSAPTARCAGGAPVVAGGGAGAGGGAPRAGAGAGAAAGGTPPRGEGAGRGGAGGAAPAGRAPPARG